MLSTAGALTSLNGASPRGLYLADTAPEPQAKPTLASRPHWTALAHHTVQSWTTCNTVYKSGDSGATAQTTWGNPSVWSWESELFKTRTPGQFHALQGTKGLAPKMQRQCDLTWETLSNYKWLFTMGYLMSFKKITYTNRLYFHKWSLSSLCLFPLTKILLDLNVSRNDAGPSAFQQFYGIKKKSIMKTSCKLYVF